MPSSDKMKVLLVDDNEATNTLITALLQRDYATDIATDGDEAIEKLKAGSYAAILLDLRMPRRDGFEVLEALASDAETIRKVIVVTASLAHKELQRVKRYPVFGIVPKPFEVDHLLNTVNNCAGKRSGGGLSGVFSTGTVLLLADLLRHRVI